MNRILPVLLLLLSWPALAGDVLVESQPFILRGDAVAFHNQLAEALPEGAAVTTRLVRRFHQGQGWRYLVVIEDIETAEEAGRYASLVDGMTVIQPEGASEVASEPAPVAVVEAVPEPQEASEPRLMAAEGVLRAAVRAHGGREGAGVLVGQAVSVRFLYQRAVPEADGQLIATNHFLRKGDAVRLEVRIESGTGVDSTTTLTPDRVGWVTVDGQHTERDPGRTLEILERFSPEAVLAVPLGFPEDVETAAVWREMTTVERTAAGEGEVWVLRGAEDSSLKEASFDARQRFLRSVTWGSARGDITFTYSDYRELEKGLVVPFRTRIERDGALIEEITVSGFELNPELDDALFSAPAQ